MAIPDYQTLMLPVLRLSALGETRVPEAANAIATELGLSDAEREEMLPSGRQRLLHNRVHWAKFYMSKAGLIETPSRGRFRATDAGRALIARNPAKIDVRTLLTYPAFQSFYANTGSDDPGAPDNPETMHAPAPDQMTPEERIDLAHRAMTAELRTELLERIGQSSPSFFERVIVDLLVAMGYGGSRKDAAQQLGRSGDGGIDGVINEDPLGLDRVFVQAKRYAQGNVVGRPDVQGFVGSLVGLGASKGVFVTTSSFSPGAREFVRHLAQRIVLIDGSTLTELMVEHGVGVRSFRAFELKRIDEDFFADE